MGFSAQLPRCSGNRISPLTAEYANFPNNLILVQVTTEFRRQPNKPDI